MLNFTGKFLYVSNPRPNPGPGSKIAFADLASSRVDKRTTPPTYYRSHFYDVQFVGDAFEPACALQGGEKIDVIRGMHTNEADGKTGKAHPKYVVFEFRPSPKN